MAEDGILYWDCRLELKTDYTAPNGHFVPTSTTSQILKAIFQVPQFQLLNFLQFV